MSNDMAGIMFDFQGQITRCFIHLMQGQLGQAKHLVQQDQEEGRTEPLVVIAQAIIDFNEGKVAEALACLKKVVELNPNVPLDIWMAIGICYFKLGNLPKAKFALEFVLEHDPENAMALTSLGVTELQINCSDST